MDTHEIHSLKLRPARSRGSCATRSLLLFSFVFLQTAGGQSLPLANKAATQAPHSVLLELFTSEGCSSCPPVDGLLKKLDSAQPIPGAQLIVLSEHVTYWDHDGWKDPNSSKELTDRQDSYESALGEPNLHTPQLIVDGVREVRAGDPKQVEEALRNAAATAKVSVRIGDVTVDGGDPVRLRARIETDANDVHNADVYAAIALDHVESQVLRGENGGRHLVHVAVVQGLTKLGTLPKAKAFAQDVQLKLKPGTDPKNIRLVVFVQQSGPGKVLGAAVRKPAL